MHRGERSEAIPRGVKKLIARTFFSFGPDDVVRRLGLLGVRAGDTVMVHSSWVPDNGFRGKPRDMIAALQHSVGPRGLLVMPSLTYQNKSSRAFLASGTPMDVRRSASKAGLLSEVFRRTPGVARSLSPTHPLLAWGSGAEAFIADHDRALVPFGEHSPFDKLLRRYGKIVTFDAPFSTITFTHYAECRIASLLPFDLFEADAMLGQVIDAEGNHREIPVRVISDRANQLRRDHRLEAWLRDANMLRTARVGRSRLLCVTCSAITNCAQEMAAQGRFFFDFPAAPSNGGERG